MYRILRTFGPNRANELLGTAETIAAAIDKVTADYAARGWTYVYAEPDDENDAADVFVAKLGTFNSDVIAIQR